MLDDPNNPLLYKKKKPFECVTTASHWPLWSSLTLRTSVFCITAVCDYEKNPILSSGAWKSPPSRLKQMNGCGFTRRIHLYNLNRKGPFILQRAIHSSLSEQQIGGIRPGRTWRQFVKASGHTHSSEQNYFPSPKFSPAQLSWCCQDKLAVSFRVSLCRQGYSYGPPGCK